MTRDVCVACRWVTPDNPHGIWRPAISNSTLVLHYAYATPGDVAVKAGRSCPPGVVEAVLAGNTSQVGGSCADACMWLRMQHQWLMLSELLLQVLPSRVVVLCMHACEM